jgi:hypothetical protein
MVRKFKNNILLALFLLSLSLAKGQIKNILYEVKSIDSTSSFYLIKVTNDLKEDLIIVRKSEQNLTEYNNPIKIGCKYLIKVKPYPIPKSRFDIINEEIFIEDKKVWSSSTRYNLLVTESLINLIYIE